MRRVVLAGCLLLAACGSARRGEPIVGPIAFSPAASRGERAYMRVCHQCHPGGEAGLGPSLNDKPLPGFLIRFQARHGLGAMPAFDAGRVGGDELDDIVTYLGALRRAG
ncbi:MAG: cytochrome c [Alphaproteobacteria bacterium]|nr:cytochrome c [Alphaproteobacteria bacterium]